MKFDRFQEAVLDEIVNGSGHLVVQARAGSGKCLGTGTLVMKFDGSCVPVELIVSGDSLMGPDSRPRRVLSVSTGIGPLRRIVPVKGDSWVCNDAHILTLVGTNRNQGLTIDVGVDEHIRSEAAAGRAPSRNWKLWRTGIDFPTQRQEVEPYLLGLWIGDGTTGQAAITNGEPEIRDFCREAAGRYDTELLEVHQPHLNTYSLTFVVPDSRRVDGRAAPYSNRLRGFFRRVSATGKSIPQEYLICSRSQRLALLAGLIDTDGYVSGGGCEITTVSHQLAEQYLYLCRSLGLAAYKTRKKGTIKSINFEGWYWRICISGNLSIVPCKVPRRQATPRRQVKRVNVTGFHVEDAGIGVFYGFTLNGDGRFLLGDFTVTHNTSTLIEGVNRLGRRGDILLCAFNKTIAEELGSRAPYGCDVRTLHSIGLQTVRANFGSKVHFDKSKDRRIAYRVLGQWSKQKNHGYVEDVSQWLGPLLALVSLAKGSMVASVEEVAQLAARHGLDRKEMPARELAPLAATCMRLASEERYNLSFDDMIYFPAKFNLRPAPYDYVFIDEAMDLSPSQMDLALKLARTSGRIIAVGDQNQAVYSWRSATKDAMSKFVLQLQAKQLPMSVTYRCAKSIVEYVKPLVPDLEARPGAPDGSVSTCQWNEMFDAYGARRGDFILSRLNAPLAAVCSRLLKQKTPAVIPGREVGRDLLELVNRSEARDLPSLNLWLQAYLEGEEQRLAGSEDAEERICKVQDQVSAIQAIAETEVSIKTLKDALEMMFGDDDAVHSSNKVVCASIHKCVAPDTLVNTDQGLLPISAVQPVGQVDTPSGFKSYTARFDLLDCEMICICTESGYELTTTPDHGLDVWDGDEFVRARSEDIRVGNILRLKLGTDSTRTTKISLPPPVPCGRRGKSHCLPPEMSHELSVFLGLFVADGTLYKRGFRLRKKDKETVELFGKLGAALFELQPHWLRDAHTYGVEFNSTAVSAWLSTVGGLNSNRKNVPDCILRSDLSTQAAFLRGLWEDGTVNVKNGQLDHTAWSNKSNKLVGLIQVMLLQFRIPSQRSTYRGQPRLSVYGKNAHRFRDCIGLVANHKRAGLMAPVGLETGYVVPVSRNEIRSIQNITGRTSAVNNAYTRGTFSRQALLDVELKFPALMPTWVYEKLDWHYERVEYLSSERGPATCLEVPEGSQFIQNGFAGWNSKGQERDRVWLLKDSFADTSRGEEGNLWYVGCTRAKTQLMIVSGGKKHMGRRNR